MKMFSDEYCLDKDVEYPKKGDIVNHKLYGKVQVWSVDEQSLIAEVRQVDVPTNFFEINLTDLY